MTKFYIPQRGKKNVLLYALFAIAFLPAITNAQNRNFGFLFSENMKGATQLFGNTLMNAVTANGAPDLVAMNGNSANGNSNYDNGHTTNMQYVDIDGNTGEGAVTRNSSSANLVLPAGTNTIRMARLYWGGRAVSAEFDMDNAVNQHIKIRKGTSGTYADYAATQINKTFIYSGTDSQFCHYQAYVDITALITTQGTGTYTVGDGAFSTGLAGDFGNYGGWSILVVYENAALPFNSVRVYDGYQQVYTGGSPIANSITLTGLNIPSEGLAKADARLSIMGWEGDARYTGDFFRINNIVYSDPLNQADNPWNGTNSVNGTHITTKNPNYTDLMSVDMDEFYVGTGYNILPDATTVDLQIGTTQDQFFCGVISFVVKMKDPPIIKLTKTVADQNNNGLAETGEILTYTLKGKNLGVSNANSMILKDSLPATMLYVPGSLQVNYNPGGVTGVRTDAKGDDIADYDAPTRMVTFRLGTGANQNIGGTLPATDSFEVQFRVTVNATAAGNSPSPVTNVARLTAVSEAQVNYSDDATATLPPAPSEGGPLPVTISSFTAVLQSAKQVKVVWSSSTEINCARYDVQRSTDAVNFSTVTSTAGAGNSNVIRNYSIVDDVASVTTPIVYYRLKQVDTDGKGNLSKTVSVRIKKTADNLVISPNPFRGQLNINVDWAKNETATVKVLNVNGVEILTRKVALTQGGNYILIDNLEKIAAGNYIVQFTTPTGTITRQVIKQD